MQISRDMKAFTSSTPARVTKGQFGRSNRDSQFYQHDANFLVWVFEKTKQTLFFFNRFFVEIKEENVFSNYLNSSSWMRWLCTWDCRVFTLISKMSISPVELLSHHEKYKFASWRTLLIIPKIGQLSPPPQPLGKFFATIGRRKVFSRRSRYNFWIEKMCMNVKERDRWNVRQFN